MINPQWRTSTVVSLCVSMRVIQTYEALPILADALQDAGCNDEGLLLALRSGTGTLRHWEAEQLVARIYSRASEEAVKWLEDFAARVDYDFEKVVTAGRVYVATGEPFVEGYNWDATNEMVKPATLARYWECFQLVTATQVDESKSADSAFTCPC